MSQNVKYMQANNIDDIQWFDVEYDYSFYEWDRMFDMFTSAKHDWKY